MENVVRGEPYTEKGSKFFGLLAHVESVVEFKEFMKLVQAEHKKASHYCFAYVVNERVAGEQISLTGFAKKNIPMTANQAAAGMHC